MNDLARIVHLLAWLAALGIALLITGWAMDQVKGKVTGIAGR